MECYQAITIPIIYYWPKTNPYQTIRPISTSISTHRETRRLLNDKTRRTVEWQQHLAEQLEQRRHSGRLRTRRVFPQESGVEFQQNGQTMVHFASNDYLGLAGDATIAKLVADYLKRTERSGSGASPLVVGRGPELEMLEERIAQFEETEAAVVFSSGYAANVGTLGSLIQAGDGIFSDALNHASIIDGCRLSKGQRWVYAHNDLDQLDTLLRTHRSTCHRAYIVTDSIFSMTGDAAKLIELCQLAATHDALLIVDEAHATGVYGRRGSGLCEEMQVESQIAVRMGTLSKAIGSVGGFVSGPSVLIEWLVNFARSYIYSTAMPPHVAMSACFALERISKMENERQELRHRSQSLRSSLQQKGWSVPSGDSPILPIAMDDEQHALQTSQRLLEKGIYVPAIRPPTVPEGECLLRVSLSLAHRQEDMDRLVDAISVG